MLLLLFPREDLSTAAVISVGFLFGELGLRLPFKKP